MAQGGLVVASRLDSEQGVAKYAEPGWASVMGGGDPWEPECRGAAALYRAARSELQSSRPRVPAPAPNTHASLRPPEIRSVPPDAVSRYPDWRLALRPLTPARSHAPASGRSCGSEAATWEAQCNRVSIAPWQASGRSCKICDTCVL